MLGVKTNGSSSGVVEINPSLDFTYYTDFNEADRANLNAATNAGGGSGVTLTNDSVVGANTTENALGALAMLTGTGTTARGSIYGAGIFIAGNNRMRFGLRVQLNQASNGTTTYTAYFGCSDDVGAGVGASAIYFRYTHSVNGGRWQGVVIDSSVETTVDLGVTPVFGTYEVLEFDVNEAGTSVTFSINGTVVGTISSGLPGAGDTMRWMWKVVKSAGADSIAMTADWFYSRTTRTTER